MSEELEFMLIGFDGCDNQLLKEHLEKGNMPFLKSQEVAVGLMHSQDKVTGISWTNIGTGVGKDMHGVTDPWGRPIGTSKSFATVTQPYIWDMLNKHGKTCGVFSYPCTYPPKMVHGWFVSGFPTPMVKERTDLPGFTPKTVTRVTYPPDIQAKYLDDYCPDIVQLVCEEQGMKEPGPGRWLKVWTGVLNADVILRRVVRLNTSNMNGLEKLMKAHPVQFLFTQFGFVDRIGHLLGLVAGVTEKVFAEVDATVKRLVEYYKPKYWMMVSDHGFRTFDHTHDGIMVLCGPGIIPKEFKAVEWDVPPTILYLSDLAPNTFLSGKPPYDIFEKNQMSNGDVEAVNDRLRDLGYL